MNSFIIWAFVAAGLFVHWTGLAVCIGILLISIVCKVLISLHVTVLPIRPAELIWSYLFTIAALFLCLRALTFDVVDLAMASYFSALFLAFFSFLAFLSLSFNQKINIEMLLVAILMICTGTVIGEFVLVNIFDVSNAVMPTSKSSLAYLNPYMGVYRPFGLTGQFSVNGCLAVIALLLLAECRPPKKIEIVLTITTVLMTVSAQAMLALIIALLAPSILHRFLVDLHWWIAVIAGAGALTLVWSFDLTFLSSGLFQKFELSNIEKQLFDKANITESFKNADAYNVLFGHFKNNATGSEVGIVNFIYNFGILPSALFLFAVILAIWPSRSRLIWLGVLFVSNIHYSAFYFIEVQLLIALMIIVPRFKRTTNRLRTDTQTKHALAV